MRLGATLISNVSGFMTSFFKGVGLQGAFGVFKVSGLERFRDFRVLDGQAQCLFSCGFLIRMFLFSFFMTRAALFSD